MATDHSGRQTMPTGVAGSLIGCRDCERRQGWSRGRSAHYTEHRGGTTEWKIEEKMQKNGGRIGENYEEIKKRMRAKFLTERIC